MYKPILSSWIVRIVAILFILALIYVAIEVFNDGYEKGRKLRMEMELRRQSK